MLKKHVELIEHLEPLKLYCKMPNSFFQFKQFTVHQDQCAMKVCTDACLFGGWMNEVIARNRLSFSNALDIGTGTGLLSLMLAQENGIDIDAIEINENAANQAIQNVAASPWKNKVHIYNQSLQEFAPQKKYDFIFSNPPFFENDLTSSDKNKNAAKHDSTLILDVLIDFIKNNLAETGYAAVLLPFHRTTYIETLLERQSLFIIEKMQVRQSVSHSFFRTMIFFSNRKVKLSSVKEMSIHDESRNYTEAFGKLLSRYYLAPSIPQGGSYPTNTE
ncbi:MAG: methyltransferase [Bacteroidota bacterium]